MPIKPDYSNTRRILVYRVGSLGDTVVSLPALWVLKQNFPQADFVLLCEQHMDEGRLPGRALFEGSGIFSAYVSYPFSRSPWRRLAMPFHWLRLLWQLRRGRFDAVAYLAPSIRTPGQVKRDRLFFRLAGIRLMLGACGFRPEKPGRKPPPPEPREADQILARLIHDGLPRPEGGRASFDLCLQPRETEKVDAWVASLPSDGGRAWLGLGLNSNQPANLWPEERFVEVVARLIRRWDVWPVVFGGKQDRPSGNRLAEAWGRGYNACGELGVRADTLALRRCRLYLGIDSGTLHLAAGAGVPCVGIHSARNAPGKWEPYGNGHLVFRKPIDCKGCGLEHCVRDNECLLAIDADEVVDGCDKMLAMPFSLRSVGMYR
jgi:heptosyltransferase III